MVALCRFVVVVNGLILLILLLARFAGSTKPLDVAPLFTRPDGSLCPQPCLLGVQPGHTDTQTAITLLRSHPLTRQFEVIGTHPFRIQANGDQIIMISFNEAVDGIVDEITLSSFMRYGQFRDGTEIDLPPSGMLGDLLSLFGSPDFMQITRGGDPLLVFMGSEVSASLRRATIMDQHLSVLTPISRLTLYRLEKCDSTAFDYVFLRWAGIVKFIRYSAGGTVDYMIRRLTSAGASFAPCLP